MIYLDNMHINKDMDNSIEPYANRQAHRLSAFAPLQHVTAAVL
jgi:hypothetical protein